MNKKYTLVALIVAMSTFIPLDLAQAQEKQAQEKQAQQEQAPVKVTVFDEGELIVPAQFKRVPPQSRMLAHEFQASKGEGKDAATARVTMMAAGGDVEANITRWKGQFVGGDKKDQKTEEMKLGEWQVHLVDVNGGYAERMGGGPFAGGKVVNHKDYAMAGAILVDAQGKKFFVKMIGPAEVVKSNREAFVKMIKSIAK